MSILKINSSTNARMRAVLYAAGAAAVVACMGAQAAQAQVPAKIEAKLREIGHIVDPACTAKLYRPLMPKNDITSNVSPLYPGIMIARDVSFGPNPKDVVDIFTSNKGPASRTVLIYVPGGGGNKIEIQDKEANAFYDNIGRWATKNGMVGVLMQRHRGKAWDDGGRDVSKMIQWLQANVSKYKGNPTHMIIWAQSAGNGPLGTYIGRPELWGPKGVGVKGAIFMSGQFNIAPLHPASAFGRGGADFANSGKTCGAGGPAADAGALPGRKAGEPGGPNEPMAGGPPRRAQIDPAIELARSSLPAFKKTSVKLFFASAELDPGVDGKMSDFYQTLHDELCKEGPSHCPTMLFEKNESHMSEVFSIDTADKTVSGPILKWIRSVK